MKTTKTWYRSNYKNYELYTINHHRNETKHITWHWDAIPENVLYESGFIHDYNKLRMKRKEIWESEKRFYNPVREYGLDGISFGEGAYHGIQSKLYNEKSYLKASDIGSFTNAISYRLRKKNILSRGYLYHTCRLQVDLRDDFDNSEGEIIHTLLPYNKDIQDQFLLTINDSYKDKSDIDESSFELRSYQKEAIDTLDKDWNGIQLLNLPCGTGKTVIFCNHVKNKGYKNVFIISPLQIHAKQNLIRIKDFMKDHETLLLDSDSGGSTNFEDLKDILKKSSIISSTFASAKNVMKQMFNQREDFSDEEEFIEDKEYETEFDLSQSILIVDEAHNLSNDENDDLIKIIQSFPKVLLVSATPPSYMEEILGCNIIYQYPFKRAIEENYICDYQIFIPLMIKNEEVSESNIMIEKPIEWIDLDNDITKKCLYLINGMLQTGSKRCIAYLSSKEECIMFQHVFKEVVKRHHYLPFWIETITSDVTSKSERDIILQNFQKQEDQIDTLKILCSIRILDEGIDLPNCDSIFVSDIYEKGSTIRMVQRLCRANRKIKENPNKIANCFLWTDDMNKIIHTLSLLKENDIDFYKKIKVMNGDYDKNMEKKRTELIYTVNNEIKKYVQIKCMNYQDVWEMKRQLLFEFCDKYQRYPQSREIYKDYSLGGWFRTQKKIIKSYEDESYIKLSENTHIRIELNRSLEEKLKNKLSFEECREILFDFCIKNNRTPHQKEQYKELNIGSWFSRIKTKIKTVEDDLYIKFSENNIVKQELNKFLGIIDPWMKWKELLFQFCIENNRIPSKKDIFNDIKIGIWFQHQKKYIKSIDDETYIKLSENELIKSELNRYIYDKEKNIDKVKLSFDEWKILLFEFCTKNNRVPNIDEKYKDMNLGTWIQNQKIKIKSTTDDIYLKLVENIIVKEYLDLFQRKMSELFTFDKWKDLLFEFCKENHTAPQRREVYKEKNLGVWFQRQKTLTKTFNDDIYKKLSENEYVKKSLDDYLNKKK